MVKSLSLYPLGVGDFGATTLFHISFLIRADGRTIVIDCPRRLSEMLAYNRERGECAVSLEDYHEILLTHLHIDHAGGIAEIAEADLRLDRQKITVYAPKQTLEYLWSDQQERGVVSAAQIAGGRAALDRNFRPVALSKPYDFDQFRLYYRATHHFPNTFAYLLDFGNYKLGYSADTAFDPELIEWLYQCDLVLHDVTWPPWWDDEEMLKLHPPLARLLELPESFQHKTLLCHNGDTNYLEQDIGHYRFLEQNRLYPLVG
jgi:ribonuclease BN (tRNA processing enzyme)